VAAATPARKSSDAGAYQQYTLAPGMSTFLLEEHVSFEDAATLPRALVSRLQRRLK
jgi:NADPH:quinone reductase-like Zn-dependent oxidoreductase